MKALSSHAWGGRWKLFSRNHFKAFYKVQKDTPVSMDWQPVRQHRGSSVTLITHATRLIKGPDRACFLTQPGKNKHPYRRKCASTGDLPVTKSSRHFFTNMHHS
jgi:hypothetical protein